MSRREQLESMLAETPDDTFLRYALALELDGEEEHDRSIELHQGLMQDDPPYVPSFFMCAQQLARLERDDEAKVLLAAGIEQANAQGNAHAAGEMTEFLMSLG